MTGAQQLLVYAFLALQVLTLLLAAGAFWQARRARFDGAWRAIEKTRKELLGANQATRGDLGKEVRGARLQLRNVIDLLLAAGFKKKRVGWEDDIDETQQRDNPQDMSWWRPKQ
jgi:hypothetical protein